MYYVLKNGLVFEFDHAQETAKCVDANLAQQVEGVPENYVVIYFSCSSIYPSLDGRVDGLDMNKLFKRAQATPTTTTSNTGSDTSLKATSAVMTNISSKNAACSADSDKAEIIGYNDMPKDVRERCHLKKILLNSSLRET